jgi:hypothetical protein
MAVDPSKKTTIFLTSAAPGDGNSSKNITKICCALFNMMNNVDR